MNKQLKLKPDRCTALTKHGARCKRSGAPYCFQHRPHLLLAQDPRLPGSNLPDGQPSTRDDRSPASPMSVKVPVVSDAAMASMVKSLASVKVPVVSDAAMASMVKSLANIKVPVVSDAAMASIVKSFANIKMPVISDAMGISISQAFADLTAPQDFDALQAALAATAGTNPPVTPLEYAAGAVTVALQTAGAYAPNPEKASDLMGATLILVVFWLVYCTSPELQAAVNFFKLPADLRTLCARDNQAAACQLSTERVAVSVLVLSTSQFVESPNPHWGRSTAMSAAGQGAFDGQSGHHCWRPHGCQRHLRSSFRDHHADSRVDPSAGLEGS